MLSQKCCGSLENLGRKYMKYKLTRFLAGSTSVLVHLLNRSNKTLLVANVTDQKGAKRRGVMLDPLLIRQERAVVCDWRLVEGAPSGPLLQLYSQHRICVALVLLNR